MSLNAAGNVVFTPQVNFNGTAQFDYTISDGNGLTSVSTVVVSVSAVNDAPVAQNDVADLNDGTAQTILATDLLANDSDPDGDVLSLQSVQSGTGGTVALNASGDVVFTPQANFSGTATFEYTVSDGNGGTSTATVSVEVSTTIDVPVTPGSSLTGLNESLVNTTTSGAQTLSSVHGLSGGGYVVTWQSNHGVGNDIFAQMYDAQHVKVGGEFMVNSHTADEQTLPIIASLSDGGFVVTWKSNLQDGSGGGIFAQRFDAAGAAVGTESQVNTYATGDQGNPTVAGLNDGGYVVSWHSYGQDSSGYGIYAQRYDSAGTAVGVEFSVNTTHSSDQAWPEISSLASGGFVVTWHSYIIGGNENNVFGQVYDSAGNPGNGGEFQVNTYMTSSQVYSSVESLADGGFVVTWTSHGQDGTYSSIYGQRFDGVGAPVGAEFRVNSTAMEYQYYPETAALDDGGFVVTWMSNDQDGSSYGIYAQRYDTAGVPVGGELLVNDMTLNAQHMPSVTVLADGQLVVTWTSDAQDGSGNGVYSKSYTFTTDGLLIEGSTGDDILLGSAGDDVLTGLAGNDSLTGGAGDDIYQITRGDGQDTINNLSEGASNDVVSFTSGVDRDQLWFSHSGNDLVIGVIGTIDQVSVTDWYVGTNNRVAAIETSDGYQLNSGAVENLVSAMAAMTPPSVGQTNLTASQHTQLDPVIAANWLLEN